MNKRCTRPSMRTLLTALTSLLIIMPAALAAFAMPNVGNVSQYISKNMLLNYLILSIAFIILYEFLYVRYIATSSSSNKDNKSKYFMWGLLIILAIIAAQHLAPTGNLMWKGNNGLADVKTYLLGPSEKLTGADCGGDGAYIKNGRCRQAILRSNGEKGFMTFLIALAALLIAFASTNIFSFGGNSSGNKNVEEKIGASVKYIVAILIAAILTNEGNDKSAIIRLAGWILIAVIYKNFKSTMKDGEKSHNYLAAGSAFAIVETIANMLGSSVLFAKPEGPITMVRILWNFIIGVGGMFLYAKGSAMVTKTDNEIDKARKKEKEKQFKELWKQIKEKKGAKDIGTTLAKAVHRSVPGVGEWFLSKPSDTKTARARIQQLRKDLLKTMLNNRPTPGESPADQARKAAAIQSARATLDSLENEVNMVGINAYRAEYDQLYEEWEHAYHAWQADRRSPQLAQAYQAITEQLKELRRKMDELRQEAYNTEI